MTEAHAFATRSRAAPSPSPSPLAAAAGARPRVTLERNRLDPALSAVRALDPRLPERRHPDVAITAGGDAVRAPASPQAIAGTVQIGASDAYMSDEAAEQNPKILNIPLAISAQTMNYNLPGLNDAPSKLDGPTLAGIYTGQVTMWDAPEIAALNPGVDLPHQPIVPDPSRGCLGRHLHLHPVPRFLDAELGGSIRLRHQRRLAVGRRREDRDRQ